MQSNVCVCGQGVLNPSPESIKMKKIALHSLELILSRFLCQIFV